MNLRRAIWLLAILLLAGCGGQADEQVASNAAKGPADPQVAAAPTSVIKPGIYGDVQLSEESGDLSGVELEIMPGPERRAEVTLCEGWCNSVAKTTYQLVETGIAFSYREELIDQDGKPVPGEIFSYDLRPDGDDVLLRGSWFKPHVARLKRLSKRDGLAVAAATEQERENAAD